MIFETASAKGFESFVESAMHGKFTDGMDCRACHTEHKGPHAAVTNMAQFSHDCAAFKLTGDDRYVTKAVELLRVFFLDEQTRMNPNLQYAQAIPGRSATANRLATP